MTKSEIPNAQHIIELSTVYFYEGDAPRVIALRDCGLPMKGPIPGVFSALYGHQSKQDGFMAARNYADKKRLQYTVIDFWVKLDRKQNPLMMKPEDLPQHDFVALQRLSRSTMNELQKILVGQLESEGVDVSTMDSSRPHLLLMQRPYLVASLIEKPYWDRMKVMAYPARIAFSERALNTGAVPYKHWSSIQKATCRINPNINITLDPPGQRLMNALKTSMPSIERPRRPRVK